MRKRILIVLSLLLAFIAQAKEITIYYCFVSVVV